MGCLHSPAEDLLHSRGIEAPFSEQLESTFEDLPSSLLALVGSRISFDHGQTIRAAKYSRQDIFDPGQKALIFRPFLQWGNYSARGIVTEADPRPDPYKVPNPKGRSGSPFPVPQ
jgi:hypothetical protein